MYASRYRSRLTTGESKSVDRLMLPFSPRFIVLTICAAVTAFLLIFVLTTNALLGFVIVPLIIFAALTLLGVYDLLQKGHAVLRNYPISAHLRFLLEEMRPEMRQYFFESEKDGKPFSRDTRAVVYQRAKMVLDKRPFGTQIDVYGQGYEWINHSVAPKPPADPDFRITIGGPDCSLLRVSVQHLGDEFRCAQRQCRARAQWRRKERWLRA